MTDEVTVTQADVTVADFGRAQQAIGAIWSFLSQEAQDDAALKAAHERLTRTTTAVPNSVVEALQKPWSWPCPENAGGPAHCCCCSDTCCDCDRPLQIGPDWENAETCIENVMEAYASDSSIWEEEGMAVDTVVNSGDLMVLLSLAGAAYHAKHTLRSGQTAPAGDVVRLVVAARRVAFEDQGAEAIKELDKASEAFASLVPWENDDGL